MAFIPYPDGVRAVIEYGTTAVQWTNTLWFEELVPPTGDMQELADYLHTWANTNIMPNLFTAFECRGVFVYDMSSPTGVVVQSTVLPVAGGVSGGSGALNAALVVTFRTATRGRSGRGRNYVAGFSETDMADVAITNPVRITNIETAYDVLISGVQTNTDYFWVVASRFGNGVPRSEILGFQVNNAEVRNDRFGSQRRRIGRT